MVDAGSIKLHGISGLDVDAMAVYIKQIEQLRKQYEAGDNAALLDAVEFHAYAGIAMPAWVATGYCNRYADWCTFQTRTLDDAFGVSRKGMRLKDHARRERLKRRVIAEVLQLRKEGVPMGGELFERVGATLDIGGSTANDLYYEARKELP
jgi:hypothetical protein